MVLAQPTTAIYLVTPALANENNGNWQTARRWAKFLSQAYTVHLMREWPSGSADLWPNSLMLALHARRSSGSIAAWARRHPDRPLVVALTGTDLYRDIAHDASAQYSLTVADRLVVLQEAGIEQVPAEVRERCRLVFQSCSARQPLPKTRQHLRVVVVGHLREEKSPNTVFEIARQLGSDDGILIDHLGLALDPELGRRALETAQACPHYRWLGGVTHAQARLRIQRAHVLLHTSRIEGGAHVIMEAITSGTAVVASDASGNVGMLGRDYAGLFPWGDAAAACQLLRQCRNDLREGLHSPAHRLHHLLAQCAQRAPLFAPAAETAALYAVLAEAQTLKPTPQP